MRPRPAHLPRVVPVAEGIIHICEHGEIMVGIALAADRDLPRRFTPDAWRGAVSRMCDLYLFQRFAR